MVPQPGQALLSQVRLPPPLAAGPTRGRMEGVMFSNGVGDLAPFTRRGALIAGSALTTLLACSSALAQAGGVVRSYAPPRRLNDVDHAIVYRREDEMTGWPHVTGFWNFGDGELLQQVTSITTRYGSAEDISHDNLGREGLGSKSVAL